MSSEETREMKEYTAEELAAIRAEYALGATDAQFTNFIRACRERNLVPGRHVYFQIRRAREYDPVARAKVNVSRAVHITSIDAFRLIAQRTGEYRGQKPVKWIYLDDQNGLPIITSTVPLGKGKDALQPWACEVAVLRKNFEEPIVAVARFDAYAATYNDDSGTPVLNQMWQRRGPEQLAKCTEALGLRKAFPEELGGLYIAEEFAREDDDQAKPVSLNPDGGYPPIAKPLLASPAPPVNQVPAVLPQAPSSSSPTAQTKVDAGAVSPQALPVTALVPPSPVPAKRWCPPLPSAQERSWNISIQTAAADALVAAAVEDAADNSGQPLPTPYKATDDDLPAGMFATPAAAPPAPTTSVKPTAEEFATFSARLAKLCALFPKPTKGSPSGGEKMRAFVYSYTRKAKSVEWTVEDMQMICSILDAAEKTWPTKVVEIVETRLKEKP